VIDAQGELTVSAQDFQGPMTIIPVSDPRLWSDLQRKALAQTIVTRASDPIAGALYNKRATEGFFLKQMGADNPDLFMVPNPQPKQTNAVAENVSASQGQPIQAYPGQDHEAHIRVHVDYLKSPFFGQSPSLATKFIPAMIDHLGQHLALWYSDAMLEAATQWVRRTSGNNMITLDSMMGQGTEVGLDRMMAELDQDILDHAEETLREVPAVIEEARQLLKTLAPPTPMDPSMVAQDDVQRQREKDQSDTKLKVLDLHGQSQEREARMASDQQKAEAQYQKTQADARKTDAETQIKLRDLDVRERQQMMDQEQAEREDLRSTHQAEQDRAAQIHTDMADISAHNQRNTDDNQTAVEITRMKNESAEKTARMSAQAAAKRAAARPRTGGRGNLTTGTGQGGGDN